MKKLNKIFLGAASVAAVVTPIATTVSCGTGSNGSVALVTDGGTITDESFNQQAAEALKAIRGVSKLTDSMYVQPKDSSAASIADGYASMAAVGAKIILAPGFQSQAAVEKWNADKGLDKLKFILVDGEVKTKNVASIRFNTKQPGFQAGYMAALYSNSLQNGYHKVGTFGGGNFPGVTDFMTGFVAGIKYYNEHGNNGNEASTKITFANKNNINVGTGFVAGGGTSAAQALISEGVDVILPVAGPQTADTIDAIRRAGARAATTKVIGVDTDQSLVYSSDKEFFLTSILKNVSLAFQNVYKMGDSAFGKTTTEDLSNSGVAIADTKVSGAEAFEEETRKISLADINSALPDNWNWAAANAYAASLV